MRKIMGSQSDRAGGLHGRGRQGPADRLRRGLSGADGGVPGGGRKGHPGAAGAGLLSMQMMMQPS